MRKSILWLVTGLVMLALAACVAPQPGAAPAGGAGEPAAGSEAVTILVDMKGPGGGNPFWAAVEKGATEKGKELGVNVVVLAPTQESDIQSQINQVEDQLAKGVDGIAIAPTDPDALTPVLQKAKDAGVPVVFIDTKGNMEGVTFIGTNNEQGAKLAADFICQNVEKGSEVAILQGIITQSTGQARAEGSKAGMDACGLNVVAEQPANWDRAEGQSVMENILTAHPDIKAVFASNDNMALGAVEALKAAGKLDQIIVVGFDANPDAAAAVLAGEMAATVAQNPYNMGAFGVENVLKLINGESIPELIDTGTVLVTQENAEQFK
jgi:ribose transport system substrate-binding protein